MGFMSFLTGVSAINRSLYPIQPPAYEASDPELVWIKTADGVDIAALHLRAPAHRPNRHTIVFSHGNAEDLGHCRDRLETLHAMGVDVIAYDYRGYGQSGGKPSEEGTYRDAEAVMAYAKQSGANSIISYGRSLGSGPATELARRHPVAGLVLEMPYTTILSVVGFGWLPVDLYNNLAKIDRIACPLFVVHGDQDEIIPVEHGRRLYAKAKEPKSLHILRGIGHNNLGYEDGGYGEALNSWLNAL